jgi:hypothetical protein
MLGGPTQADRCLSFTELAVVQLVLALNTATSSLHILFVELIWISELTRVYLWSSFGSQNKQSLFAELIWFSEETGFIGGVNSVLRTNIDYLLSSLGSQSKERLIPRSLL